MTTPITLTENDNPPSCIGRKHNDNKSRGMTAYLQSEKRKNKQPQTIMCIVSLNNILQNSPVLMGGYEQLRFDIAKLDVNKFPPKYFLGYGFNFSATLSFTF